MFVGGCNRVDLWRWKLLLTNDACLRQSGSKAFDEVFAHERLSHARRMLRMMPDVRE